VLWNIDSTVLVVWSEDLVDNDSGNSYGEQVYQDL